MDMLERYNELRRLERLGGNTAAGWLGHLVGIGDVEEGELSPHFKEEVDYRGMSKEDAYQCQLYVEGLILELFNPKDLENMSDDFQKWYRLKTADRSANVNREEK